MVSYRLLESIYFVTLVGEGNLPNLIVHRLHHPVLGLADGDLEAFGLTIAPKSSRSMANGTVRVHSDDGLACLVFPGMHFSDGVPETSSG